MTTWPHLREAEEVRGGHEWWWWLRKRERKRKKERVRKRVRERKRERERKRDNGANGNVDTKPSEVLAWMYGNDWASTGFE